MVCVEAGYVSEPYTLAAGITYTASQSIKVVWMNEAWYF